MVSSPLGRKVSRALYGLYALFLVTSLFDPDPVDLNSASFRQLSSIPGIGQSRAEAIINYRETVSPFLNLDELAFVPGIGSGVIAAVAPFVTVRAIETRPDSAHILPVSAPEDTLLTVVFLDVGNGDAILLCSGEERFIIDGGPPGEGGIRAPVILRLLQEGVTSIDAVLFTHPHADHIGGLADILRVFPVNRLYDPGIDHASPVYEHLLETALQMECEYAILEEGDRIGLGDRTMITVIRLERSRSVNEASAVFLVELEDFSMLITGDIEVETIRDMTSDAFPVTVMKVPHHGSRSSLFPPWSRRTAPMLAVFCVGRDNPYGHPHPAVVSDWESTGARILRTDQMGNIVLHTDGRRLSVTCRGLYP